MGERKVLNKYYPPDFDPAKVPRRKMARDRQYKVRLMAPFNMRCVNCGEYIYKGKKFNAMKETVLDEDYLGLHIFRFYIRCTMCCQVIAFKTDPKNTDYVCEQGATRNFENWRVTNDDSDAEEKEEEFAEQNPMAALEARTQESKQEMDILDALEEIKDLNQKNHTQINMDQLLAAKADAKEQLLEKRRQEQELKDEEEAKAAFAKIREKEGDKVFLKRLDSDEEDNIDKKEESEKKDNKKDVRKRLGGLGDGGVKKKARQLQVGGAKILVKPKNVLVKPKTLAPAHQEASTPKAPAIGLGLADYGSSDSD